MTSAISFVHAFVQLNGETVETVNARDLHERLEVRKDFSDWAKSQIERAGLIENEDYVRMPAPSARADTTNHQVGIYPQKGENLSVGRPRIDYFLSLEAAKHIAMMASSPVGRAVREYFIECERRARSAPVALPMDEEEVAQLYLAAIQEKKRLQRQIASNVLIPRPTFEENAEGIALQRIKREIAPYLSIKVISHVLKQFGQKRTFVQYGEHENQVVKPFVREGVEYAIKQFLEQADYRISYSRKTVVLTHDCLLGDEAPVSAEDAIAHLGYAPADFGI